jgi:2-polyprenyl-3-methyl-5-hydroxy-6-metoxy-1,4-benzoquinol methylase
VSTSPVGNLYDKYGTRNPIARFLMKRFLSTVTELSRRARPQSVLEVGCGEGRLSQHLFEQLTPDRFSGCDLELGQLDTHCDPQIAFREGSAYALPYEKAEFDLVVCCEVLEHLEDPERAVAELARVTRRWALVSTPYEPLFRGMNLLRGAYLTDLGNTPGHVRHFRPRTLVQLVSAEFSLTQLRTPLPWIVALLERSSPHLTAPSDGLR